MIERVYREHAPLVYRTAWGLLGTRKDAGDVTVIDPSGRRAAFWQAPIAIVPCRKWSG